MNQTICILNIDSRIRNEFLVELDAVSEYKQHIETFNMMLNNNKISERNRSDLLINIEETEKKINSIINNEKLNFYISDTIEYILSYKKMLQEPITINFIGAPVISKKEKEIEKITNSYIDAAFKYMSPSIKKDLITFTNVNDIRCNNCSNKNNFDIIDCMIYVCTTCGSQQTILLRTSSYKDVDRINISTKYTYDRKIHFKDCINQYQGKQNTTIEQKIYDDLEKEFEKHNLLVGDKNTPRKQRFKNITKNHITLFLKDLEYGVKHYENVNLIYTTFTEKPLDDISYLENILLDDFDKFTELYDAKTRDGTIKLERTSFINKHHILFQLLQHHHHKCDKSDFPPLKTLNRQLLHDEICSFLFAELGWNYNSYLI